MGSDAKRSRAAKMMREMRHYQKTERLLVPRQNFENVVRFIGQDLCPGLRMQRKAIDCLHQCFEGHCVGILENMNLLATHAHRRTIMPKDLELQNRILENHQPWETEFNAKPNPKTDGA